MNTNQIIQLESKDRPRFVQFASKSISATLNTKIDFLKVLDELYLYEHGMKPIDEVISTFMISLLKDCTINYVDPKRGKIVGLDTGIL